MRLQAFKQAHDSVFEIQPIAKGRDEILYGYRCFNAAKFERAANMIRMV